jgi:exodeoxyribonuclease VIII
MPITHNMPFPDYLGLHGWSNSALGVILKSPAHYIASLSDPRVPTPAMLFGTAVHAAALEPEAFDSKYGVLPAGDGRTKLVKEARAAWMEENPGVIPITPEDGYHAAHMATALREHVRLAPLFKGGQPEVVMEWEDPITGMPCKGRADLWSPTHNIILDIKTTQDASPDEFGRSAGKMGYFRQAAFYVDGMYEAAGLTKRPDFIIAAVEKVPPYAVQVYVLDDNAMAAGRDAYLRALEVARDCEEAEKWPGYSEEVSVLTIPRYAL